MGRGTASPPDCFGALSIEKIETPSFVFPLRKLPPRTLKALVLACGGGPLPQTQLGAPLPQSQPYAQAPYAPYAHSHGLSGLSWGAVGKGGWWGGGVGWEGDGRRFPNSVLNDPNSLFALLGPTRLAGASSDLEGLLLTPQEYVLTTFVYYLVAEPPPPSKASGTGSSSSTNPSSSGTTNPGSQGQGSMVGTWGGSSRSSRQLGALSSTYDRLLLAHMQTHLPHRQYEARAQESRASLFFTRLLHEFLFAQLPFGAGSFGTCTSDVRLQPAALHASRLVVLHLLANPCLRQGCEETADRMMMDARNQFGPQRMQYMWVARITREMSLLGPAAIQMIAELLTKLQSQKEVGLEAVTSLTRLWLVFLQPWKAPRLYEWYLSLRPTTPRLEPAQPSAAKTSRPVDVALLGMEPETTGEPPVPLVPKEALEDVDVQSTVSAGTRLAAAAGLTSAGLSLAASAAATSHLVPGAGDPSSWQNYVRGFQGAYLLLEAILSTPLHAELCLELVRHGAGWDRNDSIFANVGLTAARPSPTGNWGNTPPPTAAHLLRQRHAIQALKALGQALLCFDGQLLQILQGLPPDCGQWLAERGFLLDAPMLPLFEGSSIRPQLMRAVSITWAALLSAASVVELQPLLAAVSRQLQHSSLWVAGNFPALEDTNKHRPFAQTVLQELGQGRGSAATSSPSAPPAQNPPQLTQSLPAVEFTGSEWQRPVRGGEFEPLLCLAYWLANAIDRGLGRSPLLTGCGPVPQTEWPRMFANWKLTLFVNLLLFLAVWL
ncbi:GST1 [Symbiodinium natans]|uniref:GST1 protein n=1 Tax=Symbiodinium natans TaxID=878477 RepID=A0A812TYA3_9DINO|nr:GST1 [Symbiodinium natans]